MSILASVREAFALASRKELVFFALVVLAVSVVLSKTVSLGGGGVLTLTLSQQKGAITTMATPRKIVARETYDIDVIDFPQGRVLSHKLLGSLGHSENFFLDITARLDVHSAGTYRFDVASDDGFELYVGGVKRCEFTGDRPMQTTSCTFRLEEGETDFKLSYFQGYGLLGLKTTYRREGDSNARLVGEDSDDLTFKEAR